MDMVDRAEDKPLLWLVDTVKTPPFSADARLDAGLLLRRLQRGDSISLPHSRPMPNIGRRCHELRIQDQHDTWRIIYRIDSDAIVIVEVFSKKTQTTPDRTIKSCKQRLSMYDDVSRGKN
jgi:phage-related protein